MIYLIIYVFTSTRIKKKELIETETGLVVSRGVGGRAGEMGAGSQKV